MKTLEDVTTVTGTLERFIARENETITMLERSLHSLGDTTVTPVIRQLIAENERQRILLEQTLDEVHKQFVLDEAII